MNFLPLPHPSAFYHYILYPVLKLQKKKKKKKKKRKKEKKKGKGLIILRNWHRTIYNTSRVINHTCYHRSTQFAHSGSQIIPVTTGRPNSLTPGHKSYLLPQVDPIRSLRVTNHTCYHRSTQFAHSGSQTIPVTTGRPNPLTPGHKPYLLPQVDPTRSIRVTNHTCYHRSTQSTPVAKPYLPTQVDLNRLPASYSAQVSLTMATK